jgi:hypothetical protein
VARRTWYRQLQLDTLVVTDGTGYGEGMSVWRNGMRVCCTESDEHAGFWRYEIGLYSAVIFRVAETGAHTASLTYADDRFRLPNAVTFCATHGDALLAAQEQIRRDGRGADSDAATVFARLDRFPCPHHVFPDSVRVVRTCLDPSGRLRHAEPFDRLLDHLQPVVRLYSAVCELKPAPDGISSGGPEWDVDYRLMFYQNGSIVLNLQLSAARPQFLCDRGSKERRYYETDEWFWTCLASLLELAMQDLFPEVQA